MLKICLVAMEVCSCSTWPKVLAVSIKELSTGVHNIGA